MDRVRTAVIGIGNMGTAHAVCIAEGNVDGLTLAAVCDTDERRLADFAQRYPQVPGYRSIEALLEARCADAAVIAAPHPLHSELAEKALAAGMHALVEKPLDVRLSRAQALCRQAEASGRVFALMLNQRTNPLFARAREIVRGGELGRLKRSVWIITNWYRTQHYYDSGTWRATWAGEGGGVLLNQAPHNLDLWQWICGMPACVTAYCDVAKYHHIEVEDDATIYARYADGATGVFITSTGELPGTNRLEISGERGKLVLESGLLKWWRLRRDESEVRFGSNESFVAPECDYMELKAEGTETAHRGILQNFADAIRKGEPLISPGEDGLCELAISNAAYLSEWTGNRAVSLPMDTALFDRLLDERARTSSYIKREAARRPDGAYSRRWQVNW
ncbi:MAG: Gfo/Idh/MocA family oxidoreductase [Clostridia bacterium]|nr:Gfo/Idh/MocA family oxidoreductase [Clostridia bacterium]